jgi:adenylosuccinate synthase
VVGLQWGDEGKGKVVDYTSGSFDAVARFNGGSNAGHTIVLGRRTYRFHLIPSGIIKGKKLLVGAGVALDPVILSQELRLLGRQGFRADLMVDGRCTLVSPAEKEMDGFLEGLKEGVALGTTKMGVGPAYAIRALRLSPRPVDLLSGRFDFSRLRRVHRQLTRRAPDLEGWARLSRRLLRGRVGDTSAAVSEINERGGSVLFEGAQGTMLDLQFGTYPFVTSSPSVASYASAGLGVPARDVGDVLGVVKAYTTRVGAGPFPTEFTGPLERKLREEGREYGATTGRPRRIGWLDLVALRYAVRLNGARQLALMKLDILARSKELNVCVAYKDGHGQSSNYYDFIGNVDRVKPVYEKLPSLYGAEFGGRVPTAAARLIELIESETGARVKLLSYGDERSRTLEL